MDAVLPSYPWQIAAACRVKKRRTWVGESGLTVSGHEVESHLRAARSLLEGSWRRGNRIPGALIATSPGGIDDVDSRLVAGRLLDLVLEVRDDLPGADYEAWEARAGRTWGRVSELLKAAETLALQHDQAGGA